MEVSEKVYKVFGKETYYETWCYIYDTQLKSAGGIMLGFNCYMKFNRSSFYLSDGYDVLTEIDGIRGDIGSFYTIPFSDLLKEAIDIFADHYTSGEVGIRAVRDVVREDW